LGEALRTFGTGIIEFDISSNKDHAERWWKLRKHISEAQKCEGISIKHDVSVPISRIADFIARADAALHNAFPGIRIVAFGHMGDGNIHYNISMLDAKQNHAYIAKQEAAVNKLVYAVVRELNGSISAEHGLGQLKRDAIRDYKDPLEMELMRTVKQALDPKGLMNPGKVL
jgi:FAD/FMN-containing dehydrogenase